MLVNMKVSGFRGFSSLEINHLGRINLVTGNNNIGKTSLLESIFILAANQHINSIMKLASFRGLRGVDISSEMISPLFIQPLFRKLDVTSPIILAADDVDGKQYYSEISYMIQKEIELESTSPDITHPEFSVQLKSRVTSKGEINENEVALVFDLSSRPIKMTPAPEQPPFICVFLHDSYQGGLQEDAERFGTLTKRKDIETIVKIIKIFDDRIQNIANIPIGGLSMLYCDIGYTEMLPIIHLGGGIKRLLSILLAIALCRDGLVLIDEIEDGFHYSNYSLVWKAIDQTSKEFGTQIIATTHNAELINSVSESLKVSDKKEFQFIRLEPTDTGTQAKLLDGNTFKNTIQYEMETR